jgi:branched-chain amino acid transport system ATP-binding protein
VETSASAERPVTRDARANATRIPALEVSGLTTGYGLTQVLRDVSLEVPAGGVTALLGPNGAGKSTLLRAVSGILPAQRGVISVTGRDVTRAAPHERTAAGLCHVPSGRGIFRSLTVRENLVLQARPGTEQMAIERATAAFPVLGQRLRQPAGTLSGGQQQMLALTAAHVLQPTLIMVDEASLGLAPIVVDEIFSFLRQRSAEGTAILVVDQFASRVLQLATTAYVLRKGKIAFAGTVGQLTEADLFSHYVGVTAAGVQGSVPSTPPGTAPSAGRVRISRLGRERSGPWQSPRRPSDGCA